MPGKYTFRNKTDQEKFVPGVGNVAAGKTVDTDVLIENSDFERVSAQTASSDTQSATQKTTETPATPAEPAK